jgi:hypothetical protein
MYYGIFLILAFGLYRQLTRATSDVDYNYKNNVHGNTGVVLDQRVQNEGISCFGLSLGQTCIGVGHVVKIQGDVSKKDEVKKNSIVTKVEEKANKVKKTSLFGTILKTISFPFKTVVSLVKKAI